MATVHRRQAKGREKSRHQKTSSSVWSAEFQLSFMCFLCMQNMSILVRHLFSYWDWDWSNLTPLPFAYCLCNPTNCDNWTDQSTSQNIFWVVWISYIVDILCNFEQFVFLLRAEAQTLFACLYSFCTVCVCVRQYFVACQCCDSLAAMPEVVSRWIY